jgi:hypothetical protein
VSHPYINPYQTGQVFTEASTEGRWQTEVMAGVTGATDTVTENTYGTVDSQGRPSIIYPSAARTAAPNPYPLYTRGTEGVAFMINMSAVTATGSVTFNIQAYDPGSAGWVTLLSSAAIATVSAVRLTVGPNLPTTANVSAQTIIGDTMRVQAVHGNGVAMTYSVGADWE